METRAQIAAAAAEKLIRSQKHWLGTLEELWTFFTEMETTLLSLTQKACGQLLGEFQLSPENKIQAFPCLLSEVLEETGQLKLAVICILEAKKAADKGQEMTALTCALKAHYLLVLDESSTTDRHASRNWLKEVLRDAGMPADAEVDHLYIA